MATTTSEKKREAYRRWAEKNPNASAERSKKWRELNPSRSQYHADKGNAKANEERRNDPRKALLRGARKRAENKFLEFDLTVDDVPIPSVCPVLGVPMSIGRGVYHAGSPTLDRLDNSKGYVKGNVRVISFRANSLKSDATVEELQAVLRYMLDGKPLSVGQSTGSINEEEF